MKYEIIQSGSDGNCTIIDDQLAIDVGVPWKKIEPYAERLKLALITHEHSDHFNKRTVRRLAKDRPTLRWVCGEWMVGHLLDAGVDKRNIDVCEMDKWYAYPEIKVSAFETRHNVRNCGWRLYKEPHDTLLYATDLGDLEGITAKWYKTYLLEANHTTAEIEAAVREAQETGEFSYRVRAAENHLSYEQAVDWLTLNMGPDSVWVPMHEHKERGEQHAEPNDQGNAPDIAEREQPD